MSENLGKWLMLLGGILVVIGVLVWGISKLGFPMGKLPGDVRVQGEKVAFYFPIVSMIILSVILTIIINLILWAVRR